MPHSPDLHFPRNYAPVTPQTGPGLGQNFAYQPQRPQNAALPDFYHGAGHGPAALAAQPGAVNAYPPPGAAGLHPPQGQRLGGPAPWAQPQAAFFKPAAPTLVDYNDQLAALQHDINKAMTPLQRNAARVLNVVGTLASIGGGVAAGVLGMTALASAATGVGLPVAAVAGMAGAAVGVGGIALTVLASAGLRSMLRKNLAQNPELAGRIEAMRQLRDVLAAKPNRTKAEKRLLQNTLKVLGKVEGTGANIKAQLKTAGKTGFVASAGVIIMGLMVMLAPESPPPYTFLSGGGMGSFSSLGDLPGARATLAEGPGAIEIDGQGQLLSALGR